MAISQAEAALTMSVFLVSAMIFRAARVSARSSESHHSKACVSSSARNSGLLPGRLFAYRKGLKKLRPNMQLTFQRSWLAFTLAKPGLLIVYHSSISWRPEITPSINQPFVISAGVLHSTPEVLKKEIGSRYSGTFVVGQDLDVY